MKFDITKRLREPPFGTETSERLLMAQAADEIDALCAGRKLLRNALVEARQFIEFHEKDESCVFDAGVSVRAVLSEAQP